jgi:hypothetical protein
MDCCKLEGRPKQQYIVYLSALRLTAAHYSRTRRKFTLSFSSEFVFDHISFSCYIYFISERKNKMNSTYKKGTGFAADYMHCITYRYKSFFSEIPPSV